MQRLLGEWEEGCLMKGHPGSAMLLFLGFSGERWENTGLCLGVPHTFSFYLSGKHPRGAVVTLLVPVPRGPGWEQSPAMEIMDVH